MNKMLPSFAFEVEYSETEDVEELPIIDNGGLPAQTNGEKLRSGNAVT